MNVRHHVSDSLLSAYAAGTLAEGWSLAVATHLSLCPHCRAKVSRFEAVAGDLLESISAQPDDMDLSWATMAGKLNGAADILVPFAAKRPAVPANQAVLPEPLRSYAGADVDGLKWKPLGRGAYQILLKTAEQETSVRLLRIPAGKPVPEHSHGGRELTLVLRGSFRDGNQVFGRGDMEETDESIQHQPVATEDEDCICLAVTDAPLRFKSWVMRAVQPLLGI